MLPSRRERIIVWCALYAAGVGLTALFFHWAGFVASATFLGLGFWAGWTYRDHRDHL